MIPNKVARFFMAHVSTVG